MPIPNYAYPKKWGYFLCRGLSRRHSLSQSSLWSIWVTVLLLQVPSLQHEHHISPVMDGHYSVFSVSPCVPHGFSQQSYSTFILACMQHRGNLSLCSGPFASGRQLLLITWCKIFDGSSRFLVLLLKVSVLARLVPEPHDQGFLSFPVSHSVTGNFCLFFSAG